MRTKRKRSTPSGLTYVEVTVGIALIAINAAAFLALGSASQRSIRDVQSQQEVESGRRYLRAFFSCSKTFDPIPAACASEGLIDAKQDDGTVLIPSTGAVMNGTPLRARCKQNRVLFEIDVSSKKGSESWVDLFNGIPIVCNDAGDNNQPPTPPPPVESCIRTTQYATVKKTNKKSECATFASWANWLKKHGAWARYAKWIKLHGQICTIPGPTFRNAGVNSVANYGLRIETLGDVSKLSFDMTYVEWHHKGGRKFTSIPSASLEMAKYRVGPDPNNALVTQYEIPYADIIPKNNWYNDAGYNSEANFIIKPSAQAPATSECHFRVALASPLVLDLSGGNEPQAHLLPLSVDSPRFDLDANGVKERTGWAMAPLAFLALDRNGNGAIDSGRELFGEATLLENGSPASHGYEALAQLDTDGNGFVDEGDALFDRLLVWSDTNANGISEPHELKSLPQARITRIETYYETLPNELETPFANRVTYHSRFWGPKACPMNGCHSYDVYFSSERRSR